MRQELNTIGEAAKYQWQYHINSQYAYGQCIVTVTHILHYYVQ